MRKKRHLAVVIYASRCRHSEFLSAVEAEGEQKSGERLQHLAANVNDTHLKCHKDDPLDVKIRYFQR